MLESVNESGKTMHFQTDGTTKDDFSLELLVKMKA